MNPTDFAWATVQSIAQRTPKEIKVIVDKTEYPHLERDSVGYLIHLSEPRRVRESLLSLHGLFFDNDNEGKASLWRMYRASLYHLSLHAAATDYSIYQDFAISHNANNAMFAISMAEDFAIRGYAKSMWPGLILDEAYANYITWLRFRDLSMEKDPQILVAANLLSYQMVGKPIAQVLIADLDRDIESVHASLAKFSSEVEKLYTEKIGRPELGLVSKMKLEAAETIVQLFEKENLYLSNVHSLPYTDSHGKNTLFDSRVIAKDQDKKNAALHASFSELSISLPGNKIRENDDAMMNEGNSILGDWEVQLTQKQRLIELFKTLDPKTHLDEFTFPNEDYAEFVRTRAKLIGPIRRVLEQLRTLNQVADENSGKESGYVDIPVAIQVVASKSDRNDVFVQEETMKKSEAWAILVDSSKSLESLKGQVKDISVCLSEVARDLIPNQNSWAMYSFDNRMYIVKDFNEMYGSQSKGRIGGLANGIKTLLPDAIRIAARRLDNTNEALKVLLVASDGFPLGYEGIDKDLIDTIQKVSRAGIELIGLGIGSSAIAKYFRSNCVIETPFDLMNHFVRTYVELSSSF
ncbi:MAG: VWA domain-containing protein [archaeon]|nr:VWA domain-containing protein [archaeon]